MWKIEKIQECILEDTTEDIFCMKWNDGKKKDVIIPWCFILEKKNETIWIHTRHFTVWIKKDWYMFDTHDLKNWKM